MKPGDKVITTHEWPIRGTIARPRRDEQPLPSPAWRIVAMEDGGRLCINERWMVVRND